MPKHMIAQPLLSLSVHLLFLFQQMAEIYNTDRFGQLYYASRKPTSTHLFLAANHLAQICQNAGIPHAFLGGWTVRLRGGSRETQDLDTVLL
jgi:hypothetical protein